MSVETAPKRKKPESSEPIQVEKIIQEEQQRPFSVQELIDRINPDNTEEVRKLVERFAESKKYIDVMSEVLSYTRAGLYEEDLESLRKAWLFFHLLAKEQPELYRLVREATGEFEIREALYEFENDYQQGFGQWLREHGLENKPGLDQSQHDWGKDT